MDTSQLECMIRCDPAMKDHVIGVFAADRLPRGLSRGHGLIVNVDPQFRSGSHWCVFFRDDHGTFEFFDSYGLNPRQNSKYFDDWLKTHACSITWNSLQLQSNTSFVCGLYCIAFLHYRLSGYKLQDFVNMFTSDHFANDYFVYLSISRAFNNCFSSKRVFNQECCNRILP